MLTARGLGRPQPTGTATRTTTSGVDTRKCTAALRYPMTQQQTYPSRYYAKELMMPLYSWVRAVVLG